MFINYEKIKDYLNGYECTIFLNKHHNNDVELNIDLIKNTPEINWYNILPEMLNDDNHDILTDYIGPKLIECNALILKLMHESKNNHFEYFEYQEKYNKMIYDFEMNIIEYCIELIKKEKNIQKDIDKSYSLII